MNPFAGLIQSAKRAVQPGDVYHRLTVLREGPKTKSLNKRWWCQCECGNKCLTRGYQLQRGLSKSCGCWRRDNALKQIGEIRADGKLARRDEATGKFLKKERR